MKQLGRLNFEELKKFALLEYSKNLFNSSKFDPSIPCTGDPNDLVSINRRQGNFLTGWKDIPCLGLLNLVYDVTSPDLVSMVITELGVIPCTSVPVVLRISRDEQQQDIGSIM